MRHPTEGVLRRLIDEPAGVAEADRRHVGDCPVCLVGLAAAREDAAVAEAALGSGRASDVDVPAAWQRLTSTLPAAGAQRVTARTRRSRGFLRRPAAAALAVGIVLAGAGVAAANDWLPIFHTEQIAPVSLSTADLVAVPDLGAYGDLEATGVDVHEVADASAAHDATGLDVPRVATLPRGVSGDPAYQVGGEVSAIFTFSADRAAQAASEAGRALPPVPPGLDGTRVRLVAGPGVAEVWTQQSTGLPTLVVARAVAPTAFSSGAPFETVRDYLLSLPGLPENVATQLRTFSADGSTLPLLVPADRVATSGAVVNGRPATVLTSRDGSMAAVVWVDHGVVTAVGGALSPDEVVSVARELR